MRLRSLPLDETRLQDLMLHGITGWLAAPTTTAENWGNTVRPQEIAVARFHHGTWRLVSPHQNRAKP